MKYFPMEHVVTNCLAMLGFFLLIFSGFIFSRYFKKAIWKRLFTKNDADKVFESLKYDLKISNLTNINKRRMYSDVHYVQTIFRGAMDYNQRDLKRLFNERTVRTKLVNLQKKYSWYIFLIWLSILIVIFGGTKLDFILWLNNFHELISIDNSGVASIFVLFFIALSMSGFIKYLEYKKMNFIINQELIGINLTKKEKMWIDYLWIFYGHVSLLILSIIFVLINIVI